MALEQESVPWQPGASMATLRARAALLAQVREFFAARDVLEVETPVLGRSTVTEPNVESLRLAFDPRQAPQHGQASSPSWYLQTSPEYHMKRLLAAGSGPIYQLSRVFRAGDSGEKHNPEFTMLEWYQPGFGAAELIEETLALLQMAVPTATRVVRHSYRSLLLTIDVDEQADQARLLEVAARHGHRFVTGSAPDRAGLLDLLYDAALQQMCVPMADQRTVVVVLGFPPEQAALARVIMGADAVPVAERFEIVMDGVELANGYHELTDPTEQALRFITDRARRAERGQVQPDADEALLAAMAAGLPACAGVAVGFDRLAMLALGVDQLDEVMAFSVLRA